ncbi:MAG: hypothetical protein ACTHUQ_08605 [Lactococcus lactis]
MAIENSRKDDSVFK